MAKASSQKFIARNRAPRVQIEYDVELYGAEKKIQLPFVMGVLADLSGKPTEPLPPVADRKFLDIDVDNFDSRMKALKPRVAFQVPNTLTGEGNMSHSFANLEYHHFKYRQHRVPGDVHLHFFGTATLSFVDGIRVEPGDEFEIDLPALGAPLTNPLAVEPGGHTLNGTVTL